MKVFRYLFNEQVFEIKLEEQGDSLWVLLEDRRFPLEVLTNSTGQLTFRHQSQVVSLYWARHNDVIWVHFQGRSYQVEKVGQRPGRRMAERQSESYLRAPMPAQVRAVQVKPGDRVLPGDSLILLEAMKMEIRVQAPRAGRIQRVNVQQGDQVERDQLLVELEESEDDR